ncbi:inositol 2-dehydrogenase [Paenibacillus montaniterrae]|uniref:Inositol 2-dehydrogenase n=1 Tax=Paenibacillus montaniterrae TaxID=429341 RepID=A0A920CYH7_9BACL|nr:inositol 2-dehydrogenase [Paenibacillus montaniterrae]GIP16403.1 inositol 2-dehydrogenase [Paenibacillus montaniterrae]
MSRIGIGIVGAGRIGKLHAENMIKHPDIELIGVSDVQLNEALLRWSKPFNLSIVTDSYLQLIEDERVDAIFICSPTNTHIDIIRAAAAAGKHIFCEKPISFHYEETKQVLQLVQEAGIIFQVGFNRRFDHNFSKVRALVDADKIGEPHIIKITSRDPAPPPASYIAASGGMFMDMSIHDFDMARFLAGSEVETVFAEGTVLVDPAIGELGDIDTAIVTLRFTNGALGVIDNSRRAAYGYDQRVEILGAKGSIGVENDLPTTVKISTEEAIVTDHPQYFFLDRYMASYKAELEHFIECVSNGAAPSVSVFDGYQAERIACAARRSLGEHRIVHMEEVV